MLPVVVDAGGAAGKSRFQCKFVDAMPDLGKMSDFGEIRARAAARKGGDEALASLLGPAPDNAALAQLGDDRDDAIAARRPPS